MEKYPEIFNTVIAKEEEHKVVLRASFKNEEECKTWLQDYSKVSKTNWIVYYELPDPQRFIMHKKWICQNSNKNKTSKDYRNTGCKSKIDIKIKKVNQGTKKNDEYLKTLFPLCAVITIENTHNHDIKTPESTKYLRLTEDTRKTFESYFDLGMLPPEAMRHHTNMLTTSPKDRGLLADASVNPSANTVYYLHRKWRENNSGARGPPENVSEKISENELQAPSPPQLASTPFDTNEAEPACEHCSESDTDIDSFLEEAKFEFSRVLSLCATHENSRQIIENLTRSLRTVRTASAACTALRGMVSALASTRRLGGRSQSTAVKRRRVISRGGGAAPKGRPSKIELTRR